MMAILMIKTSNFQTNKLWIKDSSINILKILDSFNTVKWINSIKAKHPTNYYYQN